MSLPLHRQLSLFLTWVGVAVVGLCTLLGFANTAHPFFDLLGQFRIVYFIFLSLACLILLLAHHRKAGILAGLLALLNLLPITPYYYQPNPERSHASSHKPLTLLQFNTWASNRHPEKIRHLLAKTHPDFVAFEEYTAQTDHYLRTHGALKPYPYQAQYRQHRLALFSKFPFLDEAQTTPWPPTLKATIKVRNQPVNVMVVHTWRPLHPDYPAQMRKLQTLIQSASTPLIVTGDFNTAAWGASYQTLLQTTKLKDAEHGFGLHPTYPAIIPKTQIPFPFPVLPLDHVLLSQDLQTVQYRYGAPAGSDHLPLIVQIASNKFDE